MSNGIQSPLEVAAVEYVQNANQETFARLMQAARDFVANEGGQPPRVVEAVEAPAEVEAAEDTPAEAPAPKKKSFFARTKKDPKKK